MHRGEMAVCAAAVLTVTILEGQHPGGFKHSFREGQEPPALHLFPSR